MSNRRSFLKKSLLSAVALGAAQSQASEQTLAPEQWVSIIDLDRCDGCKNSEIPACVQACRQKNFQRFPNPIKPLKPYWPQKSYEDFSEKRDQINRLTPYNWLFIEEVRLDSGETVYAPRRCMHCFDAPCRKICPFGAIDKSHQGAVQIDPDVCFGGAKCRDVCPWEIPQRQAGVGLYLDVAPKFAGGGVMYKCDFCADRLEIGDTPACAKACPHEAMVFMPLSEALKEIRSIAKNRHIYGINENGGTATWYVSSHSFEALHAAVMKTKSSKGNDGRPGFQKVSAKLEQSSDWAVATLAAPFVAVALGYVVARRKKAGTQKGKEEADE